MIHLLSAVTKLTGVPITAVDQSKATSMIADILIEELPNISNCSLLLHNPLDDLLRLSAAGEWAICRAKTGGSTTPV